jgi:hypothetical protein
MDAVQRMRKKAQDKGTLKSNEQQEVETQVIESKSVIVIQPTNPEVIYVPSYDPFVMYGSPTILIRPVGITPPASRSRSVVGLMWGAFWGGASGWGCGWGGNDVYINHNNNFNRGGVGRVDGVGGVGGPGFSRGGRGGRRR